MMREARKQNTGLKAHGVGLQSLTRMFGISPLSPAAVWMTNGKITYWSHKLTDLLWISGESCTLNEVIKLIFDYPSLRRRINVAIRKFLASKSSLPFPIPLKINGIWSLKAVTFKQFGELILAEITEWPGMIDVPVAKPAAILLTQQDIREKEIHWFEMTLPNGNGTSGVWSTDQWAEYTKINNSMIYQNHFNPEIAKPGTGFLHHNMVTPTGFSFYLWQAFTNVPITKGVHHIVSTAIAYASPSLRVPSVNIFK